MCLCVWLCEQQDWVNVCKREGPLGMLVGVFIVRLRSLE